MSAMPESDRAEFIKNLEEMHRLEVAQADLFTEVVGMLSDAKHEKTRVACQEMREDELRHAKELESLLALLYPLEE